MISMVLGSSFFLIFCLAISLFIVAIFVKSKIAQIILGTLAFVLIVFLILFLGLMDAAFDPSGEKFVGRFENGSEFLQLNKDMTWESNTSFDCSTGTWIYYDGLDYSSISLDGECDSMKVSIQIHNPDEDQLLFRLNEDKLDTQETDEILTFNRVKKD